MTRKDQRSMLKRIQNFLETHIAGEDPSEDPEEFLEHVDGMLESLDIEDEGDEGDEDDSDEEDPPAE